MNNQEAMVPLMAKKVASRDVVAKLALYNSDDVQLRWRAADKTALKAEIVDLASQVGVDLSTWDGKRVSEA